ncbi:MAG: LuxR family transcriptional regulator [Pseudomonadota bacterium]|nr:LuxR family transcriptional regulator [Pseudomonadota bacterium]
MDNATLRYISEITNATTQEALWSMHLAKMAEYGFTRLFYGYTNFRVENNLGDPEDFVILSNLDRSYLKRFVDDQMFKHGPVIKWALEHDGAESWERITQAALDKSPCREGLEVIEFNQASGVTCGYTVSFKSVSMRAKGAISLIGAPGVPQSELDAIWGKHGHDLILMNNVLHLKLLNLPHVYPERALTKRQREVLEWVSDGKTLQDIATLMGRTTATVEKHLRLARETLGVETTAQAVLKATFLNQIFSTDV